MREKVKENLEADGFMNVFFFSRENLRKRI